MRNPIEKYTALVIQPHVKVAEDRSDISENLDRLIRMVEAEGGQAANIVKLSTYVANPGDWFPFAGVQVEIFHKHFGEDYPVNTIVGVEFTTSNVLLEIDASAVLD